MFDLVKVTCNLEHSFCKVCWTLNIKNCLMDKSKIPIRCPSCKEEVEEHFIDQYID